MFKTCPKPKLKIVKLELANLSMLTTICGKTDSFQHLVVCVSTRQGENLNVAPLKVSPSTKFCIPNDNENVNLQPTPSTSENIQPSKYHEYTMYMGLNFKFLDIKI